MTPANSSSISDGAAALLLMRASQAEAGAFSDCPSSATRTTPMRRPCSDSAGRCHQKLLSKTGWTTGQVDLFEINEAFAVVTMAAMHDLKLPAEKVEHSRWCLCAGASDRRFRRAYRRYPAQGTEEYGMKRGVASLCIGGGEATALAVEML